MRWAMETSHRAALLRADIVGSGMNSLHNRRGDSGRWRDAHPPILKQESRATTYNGTINKPKEARRRDWSKEFRRIQEWQAPHMTSLTQRVSPKRLLPAA